MPGSKRSAETSRRQRAARRRREAEREYAESAGQLGAELLADQRRADEAEDRHRRPQRAPDTAEPQFVRGGLPTLGQRR